MIGLLMVACGQAETDTPSPTPSPAATIPGDDEDLLPSETPTDSSLHAEDVEEVDECLACHENQQMLMESTAEEEDGVVEIARGETRAELAEIEPWEKVLVNGETYPSSIHGLNACTDCHGGTQSQDKEIAHQEMNPNPSEAPEPVCGRCHENVTRYAEINLHNTLEGYWTVLGARGVSQTDPAAQEMINNHCAECHASCGECHVSLPEPAGGGLIEGHVFQRTPPMTSNCTACHASTVGDEFTGNNEGVPADIHFSQGGMVCTDCHSGAEMHGAPYECSSCHAGPVGSDPPPPDHRYSGVQLPSCESCHANVATGDDDILMHDYHGSNLSCQVCHSTLYTSCDGCHVGINDETGNPHSSTEASYLGFYIGRNPDFSYERPYQYIPLRHVPINHESFSFYGISLPKFDEIETWKYATPHNIQRITPQAESCNNCHGNLELFLTADKVSPEELDANQSVIVDTVPPAITSREQLLP